MCELCLDVNIGMFTLSRKLTWLFEKNAQLRDDYLKLKRTWKQEIWERRNSGMALYETNRELESRRFYQANEWADHAQRQRINFMWRVGNEKQIHPRKSRKKLHRN